MEIGLRRSAEIFSIIPLRLGRYVLDEAIGHQLDADRSNLATVINPDIASLHGEESKPKAFQAYTDIELC